MKMDYTVFAESDRETEARSSAVLDAAVDAVVLIDEQGSIEWLNTAGEQLFGYATSELPGRNIELLLPSPGGEPRKWLVGPSAGCDQPPCAQVREVVGRRSNETMFPLELTLSDVSLGERRLRVVIARDITARRTAEDELRKFATQLQERNEELLRSNQELDEFAYVASHDLKEPLRGVINYVSFLIEDYAAQLDDEGRAKLDALKKLAKRMESLINSLLETSRVGRLQLAIQETNLNELVTDVADSLRFNLEEWGVEVRVPKPLPTLRCDRVRIGEVIRNLITNACKYNGKSNKWVEIGVSLTDHPPGKVRQANGRCPPITLYVRDNGIGIREKHYDTVFRIFRRLHGRDEFGGGTGVGLTIVRKIVERHGGQIWVESRVGEGSTFFFTLAAGAI